MPVYPKIVLMVRSTQDWFNGRPDALDRSYLAPIHNLHFRIKGWHLFFKMDYFQFRQRLTQIARSTFVSNKFDAIFYWFDWDVFQHYGKDAWILPIDDDDWVSPYLVGTIRQILEEVPKETNLLRWKIFIITQDGMIQQEHRTPYMSCAYALRMPCNRKYLLDHGAMIKGTHRRQPYDISDYLAVKVENLASMSFYFSNHATTQDILAIAKKRIFIKKDLFLPEFHVTIDQYNGLLEELYDSCRV